MTMTERQATALYPGVNRQAGYLGSAPEALFVWQHWPAAGESLKQNIIICPSFGHEYTHAYRSLKHLAESLADRGFNVFRFDYSATGNSPGDEADKVNLDNWVENIVQLSRCLCQHYPTHGLSFIGLRLGASLACLATTKLHADNIPVNSLVCWEPIIKGKAYLRELKAVARMANYAEPEADADYLEAAGFLMNLDVQAQLAALDLSQLQLAPETNILLVRRNDRALVKAAEGLFFQHPALRQIELPGYAEMMLEPQDTQVPHAAIQQIARLLGDYQIDKTLNPIVQIPLHNELKFSSNSHLLTERCCWYNREKFLFGIVTSPGTAPRHLPTVLLFNSGSVHHVGPNRIYTQLARYFASQGFRVMRLDAEGLGDSSFHVAGLENHPYQPNAIANAQDALAFLQAQGLGEQFVFAGICSGAYTAFKTALQLSTNDKKPSAIVLINPLTFHWVEGMTLSDSKDTQLFKDKNLYAKSIKDVKKWKKLLSGGVSLGHLTHFVVSMAGKKLLHTANHINQRFFRQTLLMKEFSALLKAGIQVHFIFSTDEPGPDIINRDAKFLFNRALRQGSFYRWHIDPANHTFSRRAMRMQLTRNLGTIFEAIAKGR